jgi:phosphoglycerate-specific signal transduction histidine kinase
MFIAPYWLLALSRSLEGLKLGHPSQSDFYNTINKLYKIKNTLKICEYQINNKTQTVKTKKWKLQYIVATKVEKQKFFKKRCNCKCTTSNENCQVPNWGI